MYSWVRWPNANNTGFVQGPLHISRANWARATRKEMASPAMSINVVNGVANCIDELYIKRVEDFGLGHDKTTPHACMTFWGQSMWIVYCSYYIGMLLQNSAVYQWGCLIYISYVNLWWVTSILLPHGLFTINTCPFIWQHVMSALSDTNGMK